MNRKPYCHFRAYTRMAVQQFRKCLPAYTKSLAAFVIDNPSGLMQSSLITFRCGGLCIIILPLFVSDSPDSQHQHILFFKPKDNPPVAAYVNSPEVIQPARQPRSLSPGRFISLGSQAASSLASTMRRRSACFAWIPAFAAF